MCCVVICAVCAACVLIYYAPSGCYDCCIRCIGAVPYPSLVATLLFYAGMALFCGCGHEALTQTEVLVETYFARNVQDFAVMASLWVTPQQILWLLPCTWFCCLTWRLPVTAPSIKYFQYVIYGLASFFFLYGILLLAEGFYATSAVKQTFGEFRSTQCGRCLSLTVRAGRSTGGGRLGWRQVIVKMLNACLFKPQWNVLCFSYFSSELWLIPGLKTPHSSHWNLNFCDLTRCSPHSYSLSLWRTSWPSSGWPYSPSPPYRSSSCSTWSRPATTSTSWPRQPPALISTAGFAWTPGSMVRCSYKDWPHVPPLLMRMLMRLWKHWINHQRADARLAVAWVMK